MVNFVKAGKGGLIYDPRNRIEFGEFSDAIERFDAFDLLRFIGSASVQMLKTNKRLIENTVTLEALSNIAKIKLLKPKAGNKSPDTQDIVRLCNMYYQTEYLLLGEIDNSVWASNEEKLLGYLIRKAYAVFPQQTYLKNELARTYYLFNSIAPPAARLTKNSLNAAFKDRYGISLYDYLMVSTFFHVRATNSTIGGIAYGFLDRAKDAEKKQEYFNAVKSIFALPIDCFESVRASNEKYQIGHDIYSKYNVLEDFPAVEFGGKGFVIPIHQYLSRKITNKVSFDLLNVFADLERANNPNNPNPADDNAFSDYFGALLDRYVGDQLKSVLSPSRIISHPEYRIGRRFGESPDYIVVENGNAFVLEVKIAKPTIETRTTGALNSLTGDINNKWARGKGAWQALRFLDNYRAGLIPNLDLGRTNSTTLVFISMEPYYYSHHYSVLRSFKEAILGYSRDMKTIWHYPLTTDYLNTIKIVFISVPEFEELIGLAGTQLFEILTEYADNYTNRPIETQYLSDNIGISNLSLHDYLGMRFRGLKPHNSIIDQAFETLNEELKKHFVE